MRKVNMSEKISWAVPAYNHNKKNNDWFWALGIVVIAGCAIAIIAKNYFFSVVIILGGIMMAYFAHKEPETFYYELDKDGLKIKDRLYPYKSIKAFWVTEDSRPTLFIKSDRVFLPIIPISLNQNISSEVKEVLFAYEIPEEEMKEHPAEKIMDFLGY